MKPTAKSVLEFALDNGLEIVSYGLAPNPTGFCFEAHPGLIEEDGSREPEASPETQRRFAEMLRGLNRQEVDTLRAWALG